MTTTGAIELTQAHQPDEHYWREAQATAPVWLCEVTQQPVTYTACLHCAQQRQQPACPFPPHLLAALHKANQPDAVVEGLGHAGYPVLRVSSLLGCKYKSWLGRTAGYPLETPSAHWARLRGSLIHQAIETLGADAGGLTEQRLTAFVWDDQVAAFITGRIDAYDVANRTLFDFKTVNLGKEGLAGMPLPKPRHVKQLKFYAWLLARNGYPPPQQFRLVYMTMAELRCVETPAPDAQELNQVEGWVRAILHDLLAKQPPPPKPVEAWECTFCPFSQCPSNKKLKSAKQ